MERNFNEWIGYWLKRTYRDMTNIHDQKLSKHGLSTSQVGVLAQLWKKNGLTQKEIQEKLGIRPSSLTGLVDNMVAKGWMARKADPDDARVKRLFLTEEGKVLEEVCLEIVKEMEGILTQGFTPEELSLFLSWIKQMHKNVE
jgi:DNA-binding MarR family transcriptional regulator